MEQKRFSELPVGTCFLCVKGKFRKVKNGYDKFNGNAIGVNTHSKANIQGATLCRIIEEGK